MNICSLSSFVTLVEVADQLPYLDIQHPKCHGKVALQGAHLFHFQPTNKPELIWTSSAVDFKPGTAIRGGVPICWPWFGGATAPFKGAHGFVRTATWDLISCEQSKESVQLTFALPANVFANNNWPKSKLTYVLTLGEQCQIELLSENLSDQPITISQALHSYFNVADINNAQVSGFDQCQYKDMLTGQTHTQSGNITIDQEVDRLYWAQDSATDIKSPLGEIRLTHQQSQSAIVWNPWIEKSIGLSNFNNDDYKTMVCIETANVDSDQIELSPGETSKISALFGWL